MEAGGAKTYPYFFLLKNVLWCGIFFQECIMQEVERFIKKFVPEHYQLFLDINRKNKTFEGRVAVTGNALEKTVLLHQKDLEIKAVTADGAVVPFTVDNENDSVAVTLQNAGAAALVVEFAGTITDNMTGMYPSYYTENGVKKEVISTQFESHFARQVFPCVDEPAAKASFDLSIRFDQTDDDIVISNMPEMNRDERKKTGVWQFETTPKMSVYLLAFAIGDLQSSLAQTKNGTKVGVFATKVHPAKSMEFALDIAVRSIEFYEDYFGVKYPLAHSYHVALPDFSAGAMENWGLITYREVNLLVDDNSTVSSRQQVALVIAHEVAHQWFGNLVTMAWWDDLWLNESFANMMEYVAVDAIKPSWNIIENFQAGGVGYALTRDATAGVQSVHVDVSHPDEINSLFDPAIVYAKGSRLMHMLRRWLGDADFSKGLSNYFERFKYGNTIGKDLWTELNKVSGKDVERFMNGWLEQSGYPVLTVAVENDTLVIAQKQFFIGKKDEQKRQWLVPLNSNWKGIPDTLTEERIEIPNYTKLKAENNGALRLNTDNTAHYIVNYTGELFDAIESEYNTLDKLSRLQLLQDAALLAEGNEIPYDRLVGLLPLVKHETSYLVNTAASKIISNIKRFIDEGSETEKAFKRIVKGVFQANFDRLGFIAKDGETDDDEIVRQLTLSAMLYADDEAAVTQASELFEQYKNDLEAIPAAIRAVVLANQMKHHETDSLVDTYFDLYAKTLDFNFKRQLSVALSETKSSATLEKTFAALQNKDVIKPQDVAMSWYGPLLAKDYTQQKMWDWSRKNWDWILKVLGGDMSFDKFVIYPAMYFKTRERLEEYKTFFTPQMSNAAISRSIGMGITEIEARVVLIEKEKAAVEKAIAAVQL